MSKIPQYEDSDYWDKRADFNGVATLGWSCKLNSYYYNIKDELVEKIVVTLPPNARILDVGCGVGRVGQHIKAVRSDCELVGMDFSGKMLEMAARQGCYSMLIKADIEKIPFRSSSFDLVIALDVLYHILTPSKLARAWSELSRLSRKPQNLVAYNSAHEITSLVIIDKLVSRILPSPIKRIAGDQLSISLTRLIDG